MASNVAIWHYPDAVTGHSLAQKALSSLGNISDRDYPSAHYFSCDIPALEWTGMRHLSMAIIRKLRMPSSVSVMSGKAKRWTDVCFLSNFGWIIGL